MQTTRSALSSLLMALVVLIAMTGSAHAIVFGNLAPDFKDGEMAAGVGLSDDSITGMFDMGIGSGVLEFLAGTLEPGPGTTGTEFGVNYRHLLGEAFKIGKFPVKLGVLGGLRRGQLKSSVPFFGDFEWDITFIHLGLGGSMSPVARLNTFAGVIYERATYQSKVFGQALDVTDSGLGLLAGAEFWITPKFVAGAELHSGLYSDDLGLYALFKF